MEKRRSDSKSLDGAGEEWRPIPGFEGRYEVSNMGRVASLNYRRQGFRKVMSPTVVSTGYRQVKLRNREGKRKGFSVHRLVAYAFLGPPPFDGAEVCHGNGVKTDNRLPNLRWGSAKGNAADRAKHGTQPLGENHRRSKLTAAQVKEIRSRSGESQYALAAEFGVSQSVVWSVIHRRTWRHI